MASPTAETAPGGVRLGRFLGVPVLVAPTWFLFAAFVVLTYGPALSGRLGNGRGYGAAALFAVLLLASVLLHELGHAAVARAFGLPVRRITITFLAGLTEITEPPQTPAREYAVAVVGPMVSLLLAGVGVAALPLFDDGSLGRLVVLGVAATNGVVAVFNLLPGLPLDGGRVLRAVVWRLTGDEHGSTVAAAWGGRVVGLVGLPVLVLAGLPAAGFGEPTIATAVFTALIGTFVFAGATAALQRARVLQRLPRGSAGRLARPALPVPAGTPLAEVLRRAHEAGLHAVVVVDAAGRPQRVVDEAAVVAVPEHRRPWVDVADVSRALDDRLVLDPGLGGLELLEAMRGSPSTEYLVRGPLPAVLSTGDVGRAVSRRR